MIDRIDDSLKSRQIEKLIDRKVARIVVGRGKQRRKYRKERRKIFSAANRRQIGVKKFDFSIWAD